MVILERFEATDELGGLLKHWHLVASCHRGYFETTPLAIYFWCHCNGSFGLWCWYQCICRCRKHLCFPTKRCQSGKIGWSNIILAMVKTLVMFSLAIDPLKKIVIHPVIPCWIHFPSSYNRSSINKFMTSHTNSSSSHENSAILVHHILNHYTGVTLGYYWSYIIIIIIITGIYIAMYYHYNWRR